MTHLAECYDCGLTANTETELTQFPKNRPTQCKKCHAKQVADYREKHNLFKTTRLKDRPWLHEAICKNCKVTLTETEAKLAKQQHNYLCRKCFLKYRTNYYKTHKNEQYHRCVIRRQNKELASKDRKRRRDYSRANIIGTYINGVYTKIKVKKRPWKPQCELCGRLYSKPAYHHWNNEHPEKGMWVCNKCHLFANLWEKGFQEKYLTLKAKINGGDLEL